MDKLTSDQQGFLYWFKYHRHDNILKLTGHAGSGKTTVLGHLEWSGQILYCCHSHQAKNILEGKVRGEVMTNASALGLGPIYVKGEQKFGVKYAGKISKRLKKTWSKLLVVVDEASMVDEFVFDQFLKCGAHKILFVGDPAQLPPVKRINSPVFSEDSASIPTFKLTQIIRQGAESPILKLANDARAKKSFKLYNGITMVSLCKKSIINFFEEHADGTVICPTNATKEKINTIAREINAKKNNLPVLMLSKRFLPGEIVFLESPVKPPDGPNNGDIVTITGEVSVEIYLGFKVLKFQVENEFNAITPATEKETQAVKRRLAELARLGKLERDEGELERINNEVEAISGITFCSHGFAMTIHKAQGSTLEHVLFVTDGIDFFKNIKFQMIYTAITRASKTLTIAVGDGL